MMAEDDKEAQKKKDTVGVDGLNEGALSAMVDGTMDMAAPISSDFVLCRGTASLENAMGTFPHEVCVVFVPLLHVPIASECFAADVSIDMHAIECSFAT